MIQRDTEFDTFAEACNWPDIPGDERRSTTSTFPATLRD